MVFPCFVSDFSISREKGNGFPFSLLPKRVADFIPQVMVLVYFVVLDCHTTHVACKFAKIKESGKVFVESLQPAKDLFISKIFLKKDDQLKLSMEQPYCFFCEREKGNPLPLFLEMEKLLTKHGNKGKIKGGALID